MPRVCHRGYPAATAAMDIAWRSCTLSFSFSAVPLTGRGVLCPDGDTGNSGTGKLMYI